MKISFQELERRVEELNQKANDGEQLAQYCLGSLYDKKKNYAEALKWYRKAADQGNSDAQTSLGLLYSKGLVGLPDDPSAAYWYRRAAKKGNAVAQWNLGFLYFVGSGVPKDRITGYVLLSLAIHNGFNSLRARIGRFNLGFLLSKAEREQARNEVERQKSKKKGGSSAAQPPSSNI